MSLFVNALEIITVARSSFLSQVRLRNSLKHRLVHAIEAMTLITTGSLWILRSHLHTSYNRRIQ